MNFAITGPITLPMSRMLSAPVELIAPYIDVIAEVFRAAPPYTFGEGNEEMYREIIQPHVLGNKDQFVREIAEELYLATTTIKWYSRQIYGKLGVESRVAAATTALFEAIRAAAPGTPFQPTLAQAPGAGRDRLSLLRLVEHFIGPPRATP